MLGLWPHLARYPSSTQFFCAINTPWPPTLVPFVRCCVPIVALAHLFGSLTCAIGAVLVGRTVHIIPLNPCLYESLLALPCSPWQARERPRVRNAVLCGELPSHTCTHTSSLLVTKTRNLTLQTRFALCCLPIAEPQSTLDENAYVSIGEELVRNATPLLIPDCVQSIWNDVVARALEDMEDIQAFDMSTRPMSGIHKPEILIADTSKSSKPSFRNAIAVLKLVDSVSIDSMRDEAIGQAFRLFLAIQAAQERRRTLGFIVGDGEQFYVGQLYAYDAEEAVKYNQPYKLYLSNLYSFDQGTSHWSIVFGRGHVCLSIDQRCNFSLLCCRALGC